MSAPKLKLLPQPKRWMPDERDVRSSFRMVVRRIINSFRVRRRWKPRAMTCEEFAQTWEFNTWLSTYIDESHLDRSFSTDFAMDKLEAAARERGIWLKDAERWDYDQYFYEQYRCTEKEKDGTW